MHKYYFLQKLLAFSLVVPSLSAEEEKGKDLTHHYTKSLGEPGALLITPPKGWQPADPSALPEKVKLMLVGKGKSVYPPSINLGMESYKGSLKDYLKMIKDVNESLGARWKDLGSIQTKSGRASLSQVDMNTEWGPVRLMHVIIIKNRTVYVVTAGALKNEFHSYYKDFFEAMKSIRFNPDIFELVKDTKKQEKLKKTYQKLLAEHEKQKAKLGGDATNLATFENSSFQLGFWQPFLQLISEDYSDLGSEWKEKTIHKFMTDLTVEYE